MPRIHLEFENVLSLLEHLVQIPTPTPTRKTILLICCTKSDFLTQLVPQILHVDPSDDKQESASSEESSNTPSHKAAGITAGITAGPTLHPFLSPTLHILSASKSVDLMFCPEIPVLRAWLATYHFEGTNSIEPLPKITRSKIFVLDLLALHHGTSEFTIQGLSRTLSSVVSMAHRNNLDLGLVECKDFHDPTNPARGSGLWSAQIPILSGSVKIGMEASRLSGRSITIKKLASRWFDFAEKEKVG